MSAHFGMQEELLIADVPVTVLMPTVPVSNVVHYKFGMFTFFGTLLLAGASATMALSNSNYVGSWLINSRNGVRRADRHWQRYGGLWVTGRLKITTKRMRFEAVDFHYDFYAGMAGALHAKGVLPDVPLAEITGVDSFQALSEEDRFRVVAIHLFGRSRPLLVHPNGDIPTFLQLLRREAGLGNDIPDAEPAELRFAEACIPPQVEAVAELEIGAEARLGRRWWRKFFSRYSGWTAVLRTGLVVGCLTGVSAALQLLGLHPYPFQKISHATHSSHIVTPVPATEMERDQKLDELIATKQAPPGRHFLPNAPATLDLSDEYIVLLGSDAGRAMDLVGLLGRPATQNVGWLEVQVRRLVGLAPAFGASEALIVREGSPSIHMLDWVPAGYVLLDGLRGVSPTDALADLKRTKEAMDGRSLPTGTVLNWVQEPVLDVTNAAVTWAVAVQVSGQDSFVKTTLLLGRTGYVRVISLAFQGESSDLCSTTESITQNIEFMAGLRHSDHVPGDPVARDTASGLVAANLGRRPVLLSAITLAVDVARGGIPVAAATLFGWLVWRVYLGIRPRRSRTK